MKIERVSRACGMAVSRSPRSRMTIDAPLPASPAASVEPPMPEPMMTISGLGIASGDPVLGRGVEEDRLRQVEGERRRAAGPHLGVGPQPRHHLGATEM